MLVLSIPNLDLRALVSEELHHLRHIFVSCAVHRGFAVGIDGIYVRAELQEQLRRFEHFGLRAGNFIRFSSTDPDSARSDQWRAVIDISQRWVRAQLDQCLHECDIIGSSSHQEGRRTDMRVSTSSAFASLQTRIYLCAVLHQLLDELEAAQISGSDG